MQVINNNSINCQWAIKQTEQVLQEYMGSQHFSEIKSFIYKVIRIAIGQGVPATVLNITKMLKRSKYNPALVGAAIARELDNQGFRINFRTSRKKYTLLISWGYEESNK